MRTLALALGGLLAFLPDTDSTIGRLQRFPSLLARVVHWRIGQVAMDLYPQLLNLTLLAVVAVGLVRGRLSKTRIFFVVCAISASALTVAFSLSIAGGGSVYSSVRYSVPFQTLLILLLAFVVAQQSRDPGALLRPFFLGAGLVELMKICYSVIMYRQFGGIVLLDGVGSLQGDGGNLLTQAFIGAWAAVAGIGRLLRRQWRLAAFSIMCFIIFAGGLAASFRRLCLLQLLGTSFASILLMCWRWGRLRQGLAVSAVVGGVAAVVVGLVAVSMFGPQQTRDRLASVSLSDTSENRLASANENYKAYWTQFPHALEEAMPLGVGFLQDYHIARIEESSVVGGFVPMHIGAFELWASLGVAGAIYHLLVLIGVPLMSLAKMGHCSQNSANDPLFSLAIVFTLWVGLFPFSAPPHFMPQCFLIVGLSLGYIAAATGRDRASVLPARAEPLLARHPAPRAGSPPAQVWQPALRRPHRPVFRVRRPVFTTADRAAARAARVKTKTQ